MSTLARYAGPLALLGGTVWLIATLAQIASQSSFAWLGLIAAMAIVGGAAVGLQRQVGASTGKVGRWAAVAIAAASVTMLALVPIALATSGGDMATPPPAVVVALSFLAFFVWIVGNIVFALSLIRARVIPAIAGGLIVLGAAVGTVALFVSGQSPSPLYFVPLALYGVGWMLVGVVFMRNRARSSMQPSSA